MKTATVRDMRNHFGRLSKWLEDGETVQILKRGKAFARVIPESPAGKLLGCLTGTGKVPDDLEKPLPVKWKAAQ